MRIKESKTNRMRHGATVKMGWTGTEVCPVKATLTYMLKRKDGPGPLFKMDALPKGSSIRRCLLSLISGLYISLIFPALPPA